MRFLDNPIRGRSGIFLLFLSLSLILYSRSLNGVFVFDDKVYVTENQSIRSLWNIPSFFTTPHLIASDPILAGHYRPLTVASHALSYAIGDGAAWSFKAGNLMLHVGAAFLVFLILEMMSHSFFAALASGLIFLVHPFNTEAVNYVTARATVLSAFFYLLAFYWWLRYRKETAHPLTGGYPGGQAGGGRSYYYVASLLMFLLSMLSKEVAITLPLMLWLYDIYFVKSYRTGRWLDWRSYLPYLPFIGAAVAPYFGYRLLFTGSLIPQFKRDLWTQFYNGVVSLVMYWKLLIYPHGLSLAHEQEIYTYFFIPPVLISYVIVAVILGLIIYFKIMGKGLVLSASFFGAWFFVTLLPTTIFPLNMIFQENRGYLSAVTFAVAAGVLLGELVRRWRMPGYVILAGLVVLYGLQTINRNGDWQDSIRFFEREVRLNPRSFSAHVELAQVYESAGDHRKAIMEGRRAIQLHPQYPFAYFTLGNAYRQLGDRDQAIKMYEKGLTFYNQAASIHKRVAELYFLNREYLLAERHLQKAIRLRPGEGEYYSLLDEVLRAQKK